MKIGIDIDGVIADHTKVILPYANRAYGKQFTQFDITDYYAVDRLYDAKVVEGIYAIDGLFHTFPLHDYAYEAIHALNAKHHITIITARELHTVDKTTKWLAENGIKYDELVFDKRKQDHGLDVLIDDKAAMIDTFTDDNHTGILFNQPWNANHEITNDNIWRAFSWYHVLNLLDPIKL